MDRIEIEITLNRDRAWLLDRLSQMSDDELYAPRTPSEHDPDKQWSFADHFIHTSLIERNWNQMIQRHLAGEPAMPGGGGRSTRGSAPAASSSGGSAAQGGAAAEGSNPAAPLHAWTERWADKNRGKPLDELVQISLATRAETLALLARLTYDDLASKIPGAPWADGTVGGILAANADHGRQHYRWASDGTLSPTS